ncbi:nitroreductase family protein [Halosquirtibacter laminarini]|uniref:Nitroreductase family protein n=1 Tax=Halosquirtibacter laminarini TaxID=3374600 RepID=A0AC61NJQ8_9BACT|nr:nitroreductase family protein [Prolixibacteraceae bacterium]
MMNFTVNQDRCTNCGLCGKDCPVLIIDCKGDFPKIKEGKEKNCLKCQHCMAICHSGAISIFDKQPEDSVSISASIPKSEELENLMQLRRSVRQFKKEEIESDKIHQLLEKASYAPTAKNENGVHFVIAESRTQMDALKELVYKTIQEKSDANLIPERFQYLANFSKVWFAKQIDVIFRNAPHMVIASAPANGTSPSTDCTIALSYFELLANSQGISTLWDGFAHNVLQDVAPELGKVLGVPEGHAVAMVMIFGYSARKYARSIQHDGGNITSLSL